VIEHTSTAQIEVRNRAVLLGGRISHACLHKGLTNNVCPPALQASAATSAITVITAERRAEEAMVVVRSYEHMVGAKRLEIRRCVYSNLMYGSLPLA
jgi:hypothetical protein